MSYTREEISLLTEEYKTLREETLMTINASFATLGTCLVTFTGIIIVIAEIPDDVKPYWVGFTPFIFYLIVLYQLRLAMAMNKLSLYITNYLSPTIKNFLQNPDKSFIPFAWGRKKREKEKRPFVLALGEASKYVLPLLIGIGLTIYYAMREKLSTGITCFDWLLILASCLTFIILTFLLIRFRKHDRDNVKSLMIISS